MIKQISFRNLRTFPLCSYRADISWIHLEDHIIKDQKELNLNLNPDFQRAHVWTIDQQIKYCEYILRGGTSGKELYFNHPGWMKDWKGSYVIVDGKQRLQAVRQFLNNKIPVFGSLFKEYIDNPDLTIARFSWNLASLKTRKEVLQWYLDFNSGGSVHTKQELQKVRRLLKKEK